MFTSIVSNYVSFRGKIINATVLPDRGTTIRHSELAYKKRWKLNFSRLYFIPPAKGRTYGIGLLAMLLPIQLSLN